MVKLTARKLERVLSGVDGVLGRRGFRPSRLDGEADLDGHLVMRDLAALDVAAGGGELKGSGGAQRRWKRAGGFENFEPASTALRQRPALPLLVLVDGGRRAGNRGLDGILDAGGRGADQLDDPSPLPQAPIEPRATSDKLRAQASRRQRTKRRCRADERSYARAWRATPSRRRSRCRTRCA